jgi:hypothetical protein
MMQNYHVWFYKRTQLLAHQGKGPSHNHQLYPQILTILNSRLQIFKEPYNQAYKIRAPGFVHLQGLDFMSKHHMLAFGNIVKESSMNWHSVC